MAKNTNTNLRSYTIYQIFTRQHSVTQDFQGIIKDLDRIKNMGVDLIYLLPIHPIGKKARKGNIGSPYSISDYYKIDSSLGTLDDFKLLIKEAHKRDLKVMMDIVINHTSRDSLLTKTNPNWFYKNELGEFKNRVGDWSDITDFKFPNEDLTNYLLEMLLYWANFVDGFRCDVAPLLPLDFWLLARSKVSEVKKDFIWLSESVHPGFIKYLRDKGYDCYSDSEMYQAFDICYDYDIFDYMTEYLKANEKLPKWLEELYRQEVIYPKNYVKLRSFENHDQERLASLVNDDNHLLQIIGLNFFLKGATMIYAGMEHKITKRPNLFENDLIPWDINNSIEPYIKKLALLKKQPLFTDGIFRMHNMEVAVLSYMYQNQAILGVFNLNNIDKVNVPLIDGIYTNYLDDSDIEVKNNEIILNNKPIIINTTKEHFI